MSDLNDPNWMVYGGGMVNGFLLTIFLLPYFFF